MNTYKQGDKMSTVEDFKNAPVGATAINKVTKSRAMKMAKGKRRWILPSGLDADDKEIERWGYMLSPPQPTSAREALDLAWELAYEVKEGQVIPKGTRCLELSSSGPKEHTAKIDIKINNKRELTIRTLDPLLDSEPGWLNAPAVLAGFDGWDHDEREVFIPTSTPDRWLRANTDSTFHWDELRDITPLYPK